jgi:signal transduction histidine kinase
MAQKKEKKERVGTIQSDFINLASHQLRTPLSGMRWLLELLQKGTIGPLNRKQRDFLDKIYLSNERMIALVNDLLEVTRLEQGDVKLYLQATDLEEKVRSVIKEKEKEIKRKKLRVSFNVEHEPFPPVRTEPNKIKQALSNIIGNAVTYTPEKGQVDIELKVLDGMVLCKVSDSGVGIPKEQQKQVFEKFFRGTNILKFENVGTGLGLFLSKAFIEASGGKIWYKSEEGKGTSFFFTLPVYKD